jgi:hypothetical protein
MPDKKQTYPKSITLPDGSKIEFHLMTAADKDAMLAFARKLPEEDMLFLRIDIAKEEGVDSWLANMARPQRWLLSTLMVWLVMPQFIKIQ